MTELDELPPGVEWRKLTDLKPYARNAKKHGAEQVEQIKASMIEFGWTMPILVDEQNGVIAGHGRDLAAANVYANGGTLRMAVGTPIPVGCVPVLVARGWSEAQKRAYVLADNKLTENGEWDGEMLAGELLALQASEFDLSLLGFGVDELESMLGDPGDDAGLGGESDPGPKRGSLLELVNITIAEPTHKVLDGEHYVLGGRHQLLCVSVMKDWPKWSPLLSDEAIFVPYPGPFALFSKKADDHVLVMVQPDPYTAGHLLDRYVEVNGAGSVVRV